MDVQTSTMPTDQAKEEYQKYREACSKHPDDEFYRDMKSILNQMRRGHAIIDVHQAIVDAGLGDDDMPKIAIAQADKKIVYCEYFRRSGELRFWTPNARSVQMNGTRIEVEGFPQLTEQKAFDKGWHNWKWNDESIHVDSSITRQTVIPAVPPEFRPDAKLENYHILWEVDEGTWTKPQAPKQTSRDPMLLKRINKRMFAILAVWDLTELEKAVIEGLLT